MPARQLQLRLGEHQYLWAAFPPQVRQRLQDLLRDLIVAHFRCLREVRRGDQRENYL